MEAQTELLRQFVNLCKSNPSILHEPRFAFYKNYLESLGAKIPPAQDASENENNMETDENVPDLDMSCVIEADHDDPLPMGDSEKEITDEDLEKANEERDLAMIAFSDGDFAKATKHYTNAIELNPGSALLHAKRASILLNLKKPNAAIRDCDKALSINPDSAQAYKFRGRAKQLLGKFLESYQDLATACKLDYDDMANEWLKEVEANVSVF
ncbi:unnamed protein product [Dracunculus medinensis]|uniref:TPR_REGION domain-containing protein n=1 Tax=Dracunculus medinensis TaxID=318479 RepID=A0A0N4UQT1_DRAME|nr:unnamed protein product [Dracunculus medinensis]